MQFLLDTNIFLDAMEKDPDPSLVAWLHEITEEDVFISVLTIADLENHLRLSSHPESQQLRRWVREDFIARFGRRVLPIGRRIVEVYADIVSRSEVLCRPVEFREALIAATAEVHRLALVTCTPGIYERLIPNVIAPSGR